MDLGGSLLSEEPKLPDALPGLSEAIEEASRGLSVDPVASPLSKSDGLHPTIARLRAKRLKEEMRRAEKEKCGKARRALKREARSKGRQLHWTQKRAKVRKGSKRAKKRYRESLEVRYSRWRWCGRATEPKAMSFEEYAEVMERFVPRSRLRLYETRQRVTLWRKNAKMPWSLENLDDYVTVGNKRVLWRRLKK